jgi:hypothetical protein
MRRSWRRFPRTPQQFRSKMNMLLGSGRSGLPSWLFWIAHVSILFLVQSPRPVFPSPSGGAIAPEMKINIETRGDDTAQVINPETNGLEATENRK